MRRTLWSACALRTLDGDTFADVLAPRLVRSLGLAREMRPAE